MTTLQEQFEKDFPNKEVREINIYEKYKDANFTNYDLDLREYVNLTFFNCSHNRLPTLPQLPSSLTILRCFNNQLTTLPQLPSSLTSLYCFSNQLTTLPQLPSSLTSLCCYNNNIEPTDISIFSKLVNLTCLKIGTIGSNRVKYNRFYGSLKSYQNLTKLTDICIEATDVNEGLEYLPFSLARSTRRGMYSMIECSPHNTNAKCKAIQNELRPFNYDLEAWQLAHPKKMLISRPEYFTDPESKEKWLTALNNKILQVREEIINAKQNETDKLSKIARLETTIQELTQAKVQISQQTQTEFSTQDKGTQTDLTAEQITQLETNNQNLLKLLQATEQELTNTKNQLTTQSTTNQEQIKQLQSKIKLLEQQKENYQTKYDKSINFIKEIREDIAKST